MDKSWVHFDRRSPDYVAGLNLFVDEALAKSSRKDKITCPCKECCNRYFEDKMTVVGHLLWHGMDPLYMNARWTHHGEPYVESTNVMEMDVVEGGDVGEMHDFLNETFVQPNIGENVGSSRQPVFDGRTPEAERFFKLLEQADKELYPGCKKYKKLDAVVKLYQIKCLGNVTNKAFDMFLELFKDMLPEGNCLPRSISQAKKIIDDLGLTYEKIDACPNDCMLFWKETTNLTVCSTCGASRYKVKKVTRVGDSSTGDNSIKKVSAKILRYFPLTPRLKRLYMSKHTAEYMRWHATECPKDGFMRHPSDSPAWKHLDSLYPNFAFEIRNVRLGLASDGFNPFAHMSSDHSTWPVVISVYNLPPWMCMKQPFLFLSLLIPGPNAPGNDIDVYLKPLTDELKELWEVGANTYDVFSNQSFNMKAAVLWTINDFPAYANLSGWSTKGKLACPQCHHQTVSKRLPNCKKQCYLGNRRFLPITHRFRNDGASFDGKCERGQAPKMLTGAQCIAQMSNLTFTFGKSPPSESETDDITRKKKRKRNTSAASKEQRNDVMHIEKNVSEKILYTLLGTSKRTKDGLEAHADLELLNIRKCLHPIRVGARSYLPPAIFSMTNEEKTLFCCVLSKVRVPDGYSSNVVRSVDVKD
ncbi:uncharacterized protein LOC109826651 [Asparagus officinalis]|uniref:uncharacterized protein LOC109826651 n=1 Tax=Asparagus officinalis TaxID=4686 RepID=UPI00098E30C8|nr:uncharacterized protein LOC109826651 [Asparagus officinalis]